MLTQLRGIVPPLITPLKDRDGLDAEAQERLIEHVIAGGVAGVFLLGSTGEGPALSYRLRREVIDRGCKAVRGRVPVLVGITDTSFVEAMGIARHAADAGAAAVVLAPPYYYPTTQPELLEYVKRVAEQSPLPVFLYNMPGLTKVAYEIDTVRRAMDLPNVIGLKDTSQSMMYFHRLCELRAARKDWTLLIGPEELLAESVFFGGDGGVCGGSNVFPKLYVDLVEAALAGNSGRTRELHRRVLEVSGNLYGPVRQTSSVIKGLKCALSLLGISGEVMADPFEPLNGPDRQRVEQFARKFSYRKEADC